MEKITETPEEEAAKKVFSSVAAGYFGHKTSKEEEERVRHSLALFFLLEKTLAEDEDKAEVLFNFMPFAIHEAKLKHLKALLEDPADVETLHKNAREYVERLTAAGEEVSYGFALVQTLSEMLTQQNPLKGAKTVGANKKLMTTQMARELAKYANADRDGTAHNRRLDVQEKRKVTIEFDFDSEEVELSGKRFTPYDKLVHNAVCSVYGEGSNRFTTEKIYRVMNNLPDTAKTGKADFTQIEKSLEASARRRIRIDATEQIKLRDKDIKSAIFDGYLLPLNKLAYWNRAGKKTTVWKLLDTPPVYSYSNEIGQIATIATAQLDTSRSVKNTPELGIIKETLVERIEWMKNDKSASRNILYERLFLKCGIDFGTLSKVQRKRKRDQVAAVLTAWTDNKYIGGWKELSEKRAVGGFKYTGITIILEKKAVNK